MTNEIKNADVTEEVVEKEVEVAEKEPKKKEVKAKEVTYSGTVYFSVGGNITPMNLDLVFKTEEYLKNGATLEEIRKVAKKKYMELTRPEVELVPVKADLKGVEVQYFMLANTLSKKGLQMHDVDKIPCKDIETYFKEVYEIKKSEARVLIYKNIITGKFTMISPEEIESSVVSITNKVQYNLNNDPNLPLVGDLHSHHHMSNHFSDTDNYDERYRSGVIFGVYSFKKDWNMRIWDNNISDFKSIKKREVEWLI